MLLKVFIRSGCALAAFIIGFSPNASAQVDETGADVSYEFGGHLGSLLPNQISGLSEIMGLGGLRAGYRLGPMGFVEAGALTGKGNGAEITNTHISFRMEVPIENIVGTAFIGPDLTYYKGAGQSGKFYGGGHAGGGILALLGGSLWFRSDMKFTVNPGTSLYIGFGFMFRL